ncbi:MAG: cadherin repeat domain-containing protein, partial [Betaproteobacteria bacterium]|nr:cadherin repeat domain-containing protein [Betaproteobacteria bacterium]
DRFAIDAATGVVRVLGALDFEAASSHEVTVRANSQDGSWSEQAFSINIQGVNEAPTDIQLVEGGSVSEAALNGTVVGRIEAIDPDSDDNFIYALVDGAGSPFAVDPQTGVIIVADDSKLDYETASSHLVTLRATDSGLLQFDKTITITVLDASDPQVWSARHRRTLSTRPPTTHGSSTGWTVTINSMATRAMTG